MTNQHTHSANAGRHHRVFNAQRTERLLEEQSRVLEAVARGAPLESIMDALCRIAQSHSERRVRCMLFVATPGTRHLRVVAAPSLSELERHGRDDYAVSADFGTASAAVARGEVVITPDVMKDPGWASLRHVVERYGVCAAWSEPIKGHGGELLGAFGSYYFERRAPTRSERRLVEALARIAALAITRDRSAQALAASVRRDQFFEALARATQPLTDATEVMVTTSRMLAEHLGVQRCSYCEIDVATQRVYTHGDYASGMMSMVRSWTIESFGPKCARRVRAGEPFVVNDVAEEPALAACRDTPVRSLVVVPLHKHGRATAAMALQRLEPHVWTGDELALIGSVVGRCWETLERLRITRSLRESEARHRAMIEASPDSVTLLGSDGTVLQTNAAGLRLLETSERESVVGRSIYAAIVPEHRERVRRWNEWVCAGHQGAIGFDIESKSGSRRSLEATAVRLPTLDGEFCELAVARDVTERVAADRALSKSRSRLDYAVQLSGVGFFYCDLPLRTMVWDARTREHFFMPPDDDTPVPIEVFYGRIHPDDRASTRAAIEACIRDGSGYDVVYRTVDPQSSAIKWVRALAGTRYAPDGTPTQFDGVTVDVTAQKLDQERLTSMLGRERQEAQLLQHLANAALSIHASGSLESVRESVTKQAVRLIGAETATLTVHDAAGAPKTAAAQEADVHEFLVAPLVGRNGAPLGELRVSNKAAGRFSEVDEAVLAQLAHISAVAIQNARLYDQLRDHDRRKDEFLAMLAHELRNPLAPIRTGLDVLKIAGDSSTAARARDMMERQLGHMVRMIDDLLDISRITLGKLQLRKELIDFRVAVDHALETTLPLLEMRGHQFVLRLPEHPVLVEADPTRLAQIVANLVNNAAKYTPAAGRIELTAEATDGQLVVRVTDTGLGIPRDKLPKIFEMFTQLDRSQGGLGIGLTLVRRLVEMHSGSIEVASEGEGYGSTFTVRLPLAEARAESAPHGVQAPLVVGRSLRVLVVDDNADAAECLTLLLELRGHRTRMAYSGREALEAAAIFHPDVIFLDIGLPELDGYQVAQRLRADPEQRQTVLVALTGWGSTDDRRRAQEAGFDQHLVKPLDASKLEGILASVQRNGSSA